MLVLDEGVISLTRGDTGYLELVKVNQTDKNDWEIDDIVTLSVKEKIDSEDYLFQRQVQAGQPIIIYPSDTRDLEYGRYVYDIQINTVLGEVFTVAGPEKFILTKEVTI